MLAIGSAVVLIGLLNFLKPKLIDFQAKIYVDNEKSINRIAVSYPGHWREMHLEDGRVLLNINPHRRFGGSMRMIADANKIASPVTLAEQGHGEHQVIFDVYNPVVTQGTWGWADRPRAFFNIPLLGTVQIPKFENELAGKALLLDENRQVECRYLFEARGKVVRDTTPNSHVAWNVESTVEDRSMVDCRQ